MGKVAFEVQGHCLANWFVAVWNGKGWTMEGPYTESYGQDQFERHQQAMPNCPVRLVEMAVHGTYR